jgi:tryptophanyl-tRNA synthetase
MTRDITRRLGKNYLKPALMHSKFLPALSGSKMSSSVSSSAIYLTDTPSQIKNKINKYAFSGGKPTLEEHRKFGANLEVDVAFQLLKIFLDDDLELEFIASQYSSGQMLTADVKNRAIEVVSQIVKQHQESRTKITEEVVREFMVDRPLE